MVWFVNIYKGEKDVKKLKLKTKKGLKRKTLEKNTNEKEKLQKKKAK